MKIIRDTREQTGWTFGELDVETKKLDTGDYSMVGYEDYICIERKKSVSEIAINIGSDSARFNRELERMKEFPLAYIICEFSIEDILKFPQGSNIPKSQLARIRIGGKYILKVLSSYKEKYRIEVIYAGDRYQAIEEVLQIFQNVIKKEQYES